LDIYKGDAEIIIPRVETSSKNENLEIPIHVNIIQGEPYRGDRPFEATFEVNPKIFLPTSVQSNRGDAELISNISSSNKREFKVRVNGNFDESGLLATIKGVAGLSDTNYSDLIINESSLNFGTNVNVLVKNGGIFINDICNDRYIYNDLNQVEINGLSPNPANEYINLDFESTSVNDVRIELIDNLGSVLFSVNNFKTKIGTNRITFKINSLGIGNYKINIYSDVSVKSASFIIMR